MKKTFFLFVTTILVISACTKVEKVPTSGITTIENTIHRPTNPYVFGFSFSTAEIVANNVTPGPDILIFVNTDATPYRLTLQADNLKPSFCKIGDYSSEADAIAAFNNLHEAVITRWEEMADPISPNQIWIFRTGSDTYAKIRIISTVNEIRQTVPYGECKFQWVYQPDGSLTFLGK
jgi:hypothetical protein